MNNEDEIEENYYQCLYCGATFDSEDERDSHTFEKHMDAVEEKLSQIRNIAEENKETIENWKDAKKKELLLKIATERPSLLHIIQTSPHSDEMLDKEIEMDLFKRALHTNSLDSFSAMWIRHPKFEEIYRASRSKPEHQPQTGDSTSQDEQFFESPNAMIDTTKTTNIRGKENLTEDEIKKKQLVLILYSLLRKQKK
jgi:hypothetical protein